MKTLAAALITLSTPVVAQSSEWVAIARSTTGTIWKMRASDIANSSDYSPTVWIILDHTSDKTRSENQTKELVNFDCRKKSYQAVSITTYRSNGTVIDTHENMANPYLHSYAPPDSVIETAMQSACPADK